MRCYWLTRLLLVVMVLSLCTQSTAQDAPERTLEEAAIQAFLEGRYPESRALLEQQIAREPASPVPWYNLACVHVATGAYDSGIEALLKSVELGFADRRQLQRDPHLTPLRSRPEFQTLLDRWDEVLESRAIATMQRHQEAFGRAYTYTRDPEHRLLFVNSYTEQSFADAQAEIDRVWTWAQAEVFAHEHTDRHDPLHTDAWVSVILPTPQRFRAWVTEHFGAGAFRGISQVGGLYDHDAQELWAADLGGTLRHEFFHVMHWRSMMRLGQRHPMWVQEGMASLVETLDLVAGQLRPVPCIRTNIVRRHARTGHLLPIADLVSQRGAIVQRDQPLRFYAQTRGIFLFLHERGVLGDFYAHFTRHGHEDTSGMTSLLSVLGLEAAEFDGQFRSWALALPEIPEEVRSGDAALGVRVDVALTGEGLEVTGFPGRRPGSLRLGDIITHVAGRPTRDYFELVRVITAHEPGETVEVRYRRRTTHASTEITLQRAP